MWLSEYEFRRTSFRCYGVFLRVPLKWPLFLVYSFQSPSGGTIIVPRLFRTHLRTESTMLLSVKTVSVANAGNCASTTECASEDTMRPSRVWTGKSGAPPRPG